MFCKNCGNQIADNAPFCNACGAAQGGAQQAQPQYQQQAPQQQYAPQPNYAVKPNLLNSPFTNKHFTFAWVLSAVLSLVNLMFWYMPCISLGDDDKTYTAMSTCFTEDYAEGLEIEGLLFFFIIAIALGLVGTVMAILPIWKNQVAKPSWIPLLQAGYAIFNFIFIFVLAFNENWGESGLSFWAWMYMLVIIATVAVNVVLWGKQKRMF